MPISESQEELKSKVLDKIEDLKQKILTNENFPEGELNFKSLVEIDDRLEEILNFWYY